MKKKESIRLLEIAYIPETNSYSFEMPKGTSLGEVAFGISALARLLAKQEILKKPDEFIDMINRYLHDTQFDEITQSTPKEDVPKLTKEGEN